MSASCPSSAWQRFKNALRPAPAAKPLDPNSPAQIGLAHYGRGDATLARPYLEQAVLTDPRNLDVLRALGECRAYFGEYDGALEIYSRILDVKPGDMDALLGHATVHFLRGNDAGAADFYHKAVQAHPQDARPLAEYARYFQYHMKIDDAVKYYDAALNIEPLNSFALTHLGILRGEEARHADALDLFHRAMKADPNNDNIPSAMAHVLLAKGDYIEGWKYYELGVGKRHGRNAPYLNNVPVWHGGDITGKTLVIIGEQGLGDILQFVRYAALCKERAGRVIFLSPPELVQLLSNCPFIDEVINERSLVDGPAPPCDVQVLCMSLPHVLGTTMATIPATVPYLFVPDDLQKKWPAKLPASDGRPRIGLVWRGSMAPSLLRGELKAERRNMQLKNFLPIVNRDDVVFVNLQYDRADAAQIGALGLTDRFIDPMPDVRNYLDTAALVQSLDLVIAVDTSIVHLVGGLGKPVWVLSRFDACWRWFNNRADSPWYPTARVFGQETPGDWDQVVADVSKALDAWKP